MAPKLGGSALTASALAIGAVACIFAGLRYSKRDDPSDSIENELADVDPGPLFALGEIGTRHVCVIGAGSIGSSFCAVWLARGRRVVCIDPYVEKEMLMKRIENNWAAVKCRGFTKLSSPPFELLCFEKESEEAIREAGFIQECSIENIEVKQELLSKLDELADPRVIIASSSSFIPCDVSARYCKKNAARVMIGHPTIPHLECFMEIYSKSDAVLAVAKSWYREAGFDVIIMRKTVPGHVYNIFLATALRQAHHLVREGVCSPEDVNTALRHLGRDFYARNGYLALLTTIGGQTGVEGGKVLTLRIRESVMSIIAFLRMQELGLPRGMAKMAGDFIVRKLGPAIAPVPPPEYFESSARFEDIVTSNHTIPIQTAMYERIERPLFERLPYEVDNDRFQLQGPLEQ